MVITREIKREKSGAGFDATRAANALGVSKQATLHGERGVKVPASIRQTTAWRSFLTVPKGYFYRNRNCAIIPYAHATQPREGGVGRQR